eukprot:m.117990 g.117990  ORF g.117990 m.117990 type:complete len:462 (-) comp28624_c0_seq1:355-1740(-)
MSFRAAHPQRKVYTPPDEVQRVASSPPDGNSESFLKKMGDMLGFKSVQAQQQPQPLRPSIPGTRTSIAQLHSQGTMVSADGSCALVHESSSPPNYYRARYNTPEGEVINMDRGGFGHHNDRVNYGCVFDGVTSGGKINAYAAQAFADYTCAFLQERATMLKTTAIETFASELFSGCIAPTNNPKRRMLAYDAEGGSATGVYVTISDTRKKDHFEVTGANIGDAAALMLNETQTEARLISATSLRATGRPTDTGGQLTMSMGINGDIWPFKCPCKSDEIIILCTDGLTDNLHLPELGTIIPFIARCPEFDRVPTMDCRTCYGENPHYPSFVELQDMLGKVSPSLASATQVAQRLCNYTRWVTTFSYNSEQEYYATDIKIRQLQSEKMQLVNAKKENPDLITVLGADSIRDLIHKLELQLELLGKKQVTRMKSRKVMSIGKTDDSIILCMKPKHALIPTPVPV